MTRYFLLLCLLFVAPFGFSQEKLDIDLSSSCSFDGAPIETHIYGFKSSAEAKGIVDQIVGHIGLKRNFQITAGNVPNAVATIKKKYDGTYDRYIIYSQSFITHIINQTNSYWAAIGIMAHEVAHHLNGHTLKGGSRPPTELEADEFAGFILYKMGATLEEAQKMFNNKTMYQRYDSNTHPATSARLEAVAVGWQRAKERSSDRKEYTPPRREPVKTTTTYETNKPKTTTNTTTYKKKVDGKFNKVWAEHNVYEYGVKGMKIHADYNINNMKGTKGKLVAYFYYKDGTKLKDTNKKYRTTDGQVSTSKDFNPNYDRTLYSDYWVFIPYDEFHLGTGKTNLKCKFIIFEYTTGQPKSVVHSEDIHFYYTK
ncbi:MAG: hypothetical protein AAF901_02245 [Bacteroidota bacterium]